MVAAEEKHVVAGDEQVAAKRFCGGRGASSTESGHTMKQDPAAAMKKKCVAVVEEKHVATIENLNNEGGEREQERFRVSVPRTIVGPYILRSLFI